MRIQNNILESVDNSDIIGGVFNIPDGITSIGDMAFYGCSGLTSVTIPNSVESIVKRAFRDCISLKSIVIPNSVKWIGNSAFRGCTSLTSVTIPDSVKSIGRYAFYGCTSLKSIIIPDSVESIRKWAFKNCTNLSSHNINKSDVIDLAISLLPEYGSLCSCLDEATRIMSMRCGQAICVQAIFPNFKREIAIEKFGGRDEGYWWPIKDKASRLSFLEWLRNN